MRIEREPFAKELRTSVEAEMVAGARWHGRGLARTTVVVALENRFAYLFARWVVQGMGLTQHWD